MSSHVPAIPPVRPGAESLLAAKAAARPTALSAGPDAVGLLKALRRRLGLALGLGFLAAIVLGGTGYALIPRAKYTATASLHVATRPKRIIFDPQEGGTDYRTYQKTQTTLLKNRKVLAHALAKPEVAALSTLRQEDDPAEWLETNLKADFPGGSEVLVVSLSGDRPEDLSKIVNAVVKSYMTVVVEQEYRERVARLDALKKLREKYDSELKLKRRTLRETVSAVGLTDQKALALSQQFKTEHLGMAQRELMHAQSELLKVQAELTVLEGRPPQAGADRQPVAPGRPQPVPAVPTAIVERDPKVAEARNRLDRLAGQIREASQLLARPYDPALLRLRRQQAAAEQLLRDRRAAAASELAAGASRVAGGGPAVLPGLDGLNDVARARSQAAVWKSYGDALAKDIERLQGELKDVTDKGLDLENEREEIAIASDVSRKVGSEAEAVQVELGAPDRIQQLAEAKVPSKKDELRKLKGGGGAALAGFLFAILGVSYWEFRARRVDAVAEVVDGLGFRLVGTLPAMPRRARPSAEEATLPERRWRNRLVESVDAMRAVLLHASRADGLQVVMVTSAIKGEGKTSLACHLATSLARAGRRTLLVDGDLRSPSCHRLYGLPNVPGLCELLRGEASVEEAVRDAEYGGTALIPAGRIDALALQALNQDGLRSLLDDLKGRYDYILIDSAPVLPVADSLAISQSADAVIFAVMRDVSRLPMVYSAYERLAALGVRVLGAVVSGVPENSHAYEYYSHEQQ